MRSLKTMIEEELQADFELGQLALEDLSAFKSGFIAEGMAFLPNLMASLEPRNQIVYLIPTTSFQTEHYARREWVNGLLQTTPNPKETFANWMARDATNAQRIAQEAALNNFPVLLVDGSMDIQQTLAWAEKQFQL